jgi:hypothetical protein
MASVGIEIVAIVVGALFLFAVVIAWRSDLAPESALDFEVESVP